MRGVEFSQSQLKVVVLARVAAKRGGGGGGGGEGGHSTDGRAGYTEKGSFGVGNENTNALQRTMRGWRWWFCRTKSARKSMKVLGGRKT